MAELLGATLGATLMVPGQRPRSLTPRYKSRSRSRRSRERSGSPLPYLMRDDREKSPFEVGESHRLQLAASKAIIDKALIMDISKGTEEDEDAVLYLTTDISVIDRACVIDVSPVTLYVLEEDDYDDDESIIDENDSARSSVEPSSDRPSAEPEDGEEIDGEGEGEKKKKKKKKQKPKEKKKKGKEITPPLTLKLDVKPPPKKLSNKMFESKGTVEEERPKPEPRKKGNKLAFGDKFNAAPVDEAPPMKKKEPSKWDKKPDEAPKIETAAEQQARIEKEKEEKKAKAEARAERAEAKAERAEAKAEAKAQKAEDKRVKQEEMDAKVALMTPDEKEEHEAEQAAEQAATAAEEAVEEEESNDEEDEEEGQGEDDDGKDDDEYGESREFGTTMDEDDFDEESEEEEEVDPREVVYLTPKDPITNWEAAVEVELEDEPITFITSPKDPPMTEKQRDQEWQRLREANRLPIIHSFLSDRVAPENANVKLTLTVSGPDIQVKWFKGGEQLEKGPRAKMTVREGLLTLEIPNAVISDSGEYSCVVKNKNGDVATTCLVNVYKVIKEAAVPPTFTSIRGTQLFCILISKCYISTISFWYRNFYLTRND